MQQGTLGRKFDNAFLAQEIAYFEDVVLLGGMADFCAFSGWLAVDECNLIAAAEKIAAVGGKAEVI